MALLTEDELGEMRVFVSEELHQTYIDSYAEDWEDTSDPETHFDDFIEEMHAAMNRGDEKRTVGSRSGLHLR